MVPLKVFENGSIHELKSADFSHGIIELCEKHREESRALAFAFLIYDFCNPQTIKVLEDVDYWNALNTISGKYLSIYYIHSREKQFAEDLVGADDFETRGMHPINAGGSFSHVLQPFQGSTSFRSLCKDSSSRDMGFVFTAFTVWPRLFRASGMFTKS